MADERRDHSTHIRAVVSLAIVALAAQSGVSPRDADAAPATTRITVDVDGGDPNEDSSRPVVSANGRYVAFDSAASDLVPGDVNDFDDVFVRDVVAGTTTRVSVDVDGGDAEVTVDPGGGLWGAGFYPHDSSAFRTLTQHRSTG